MNLAGTLGKAHASTMRPWSRRALLCLLAGLTVACLLPGWMRFDPARLALLTQPSAWLAGHLMAVPVQLPSGEPPLLLQGQHSLRVVDGCSGADFFGLLAGLLLWVTLSRRPRLAWLVLPVAYVLTVGANAGRLAAILVMESNLSPHVPIYLHGSLHAATGIAVFLPLMIVTYAACERMVCDDRRLL